MRNNVNIVCGGMWQYQYRNGENVNGVNINQCRNQYQWQMKYVKRIAAISMAVMAKWHG
jgi:hypothetical protein